MDTQAALSQLSRFLRCKPSVFGFAGTKDKRAVTVQQVTAHRLAPGRLAGLNKALPPGLKLGDFRPSAK